MKTERLKEILILTLDTEESAHRLGQTLDKLSNSDAKDIPTRVVYGMNGESDVVPRGLLGGRWEEDLIHFKGSQAVCYSHLMAMMSAYTSCREGEFAMILEDDVNVHPEIVWYLMNTDIHDFDFLHLSYWNPKCGKHHQLPHSRNVAKIINPTCTGAFSYLVNPRRAVPKLLDLMPFTSEVDNFISKEHLDRFDIYCIDQQPWLTSHRSSGDIRNRIDKESWRIANLDSLS